MTLGIFSAELWALALRELPSLTAYDVESG
jgi:hypothetical protein